MGDPPQRESIYTPLSDAYNQTLAYWQVQGRRGFSTKLFDCCAPPGEAAHCCFTTFCTPCAFAKNVERLTPKELPLCGGNCCGSCCLFYLACSVGSACQTAAGLPILCWCSWCYHMQVRKAIRVKYGLAGDGLQDFLITACCAPCAICQESRELDLHGALPVTRCSTPVMLVSMPTHQMTAIDHSGYPTHAIQPSVVNNGVAMGYPAAMHVQKETAAELPLTLPPPPQQQFSIALPHGVPQSDDEQYQPLYDAPYSATAVSTKET